jgi:hypothetical protein
VELNEKKFYLKIVATLIKSSTTNKYHNNITLAQNLEKKSAALTGYALTAVLHKE